MPRLPWSRGRSAAREPGQGDLAVVAPDAATREEPLLEEGLQGTEPVSAVPGVPSAQLTFRASLTAAVEVIADRFFRYWLCAVTLLVLGMFCVLIWSQWVYDNHHADRCDQPLAFMLRLLYISIAVNAFQREIIRHILCYDMVRDGPDEPCRVMYFRRLSLSSTLVWPIVSGFMLLQTHHCTSELQMAVRVIVGYYALVLNVVVIAPFAAVMTTAILIRRGVMRIPRNRNAAPEELIAQLPQVEYDESVFDDSGAPGTFPSQCSICLDNFDRTRTISRTTCKPFGHAFHTDCLSGWLQCARTCPLCRVDLTDPENENGETQDQANSSLELPV